MKIVYAITATKKESYDHFEANVKLLRNMNIDLTSVLNTNHELISDYADVSISDVGGMKQSRESLLKEISKIGADAYMVFDSDIVLDESFIKDFKEIVSYKNNYDFVSLYYKGDPPTPAFFTLASSLNDYYNEHTRYKEYDIEIPFFDDTEVTASEYQKFNVQKSNKKFSEILWGRSYARDIPVFRTSKDTEDTTTGGATIYFNKDSLLETFEWESLSGKSLTWYDSYRTYMMTKKYKFCKIPFFVVHRRHKGSISLSYDSVERYVLGYIKYMSAKNNDWNSDVFVFHVLEMYMYIQGMIKKLRRLELPEDDIEVIDLVDDFVNNDDFFFLGTLRGLLWK